MEKHSSFTVKSLNALPNAKKGSRDTYYDTKVSGLSIRVTSTGVKSFAVRKFMNNKAVRTTLGHYPAMTIAQARDAARKALNTLSAGTNPNVVKKAQRMKTITLQEAMKDYIANCKHERRKDKTIRDYQIIFNSYLSEWSTKELTSITTEMVKNKHKKIGDKTIYRANATMRLLRAIFNFAIEESRDKNNGEPLIKYNPVNLKKKWYKEKARENIIRQNDLKDWFQAVQNLPNDKSNITHKNSSETVRDYLVLLLFTGLRPGEGINLVWSNIDFKNKILSIKDTKNRRDHEIPLGDYIIKLLEQRKQESEGEFVFPGNSSNKALVSANRQVKKVIKDSGVEFLLHDIRRTFSTYAKNLKIDYLIIKKMLNHKFTDVTAVHYIQLTVEDLREPMTDIEEYILELIK